MVRQRNKVNLTIEDRKCLDSIVKSNKSTGFDKLKAQVLLLIDIGKHGPKLTYADITEQLKVSSRSIGRIKEAYAQNSSIQDVFRFDGLSDQSNQKFDNKQSSNHKKKKNIRYVENENSVDGDFLLEHIKCRVTLTKDEREKLESSISEGKHTIRKIYRAKILLLADEGTYGPAMRDNEIADKLDVSKSTIQRVRKLLITKGGIEDVLNFNHKNAGRPRKIDGVTEAVLVAQVCSKPPEGRCRWTLRLLAERLVELEVVDSISHGAVGTTLKKMNLSLGKGKNG